MEQSLIKQIVQRDCKFTNDEPFEVLVEIISHIGKYQMRRELVRTFAYDDFVYFIITQDCDGDIDAKSVSNYDQGIRMITNLL